jgi:hypothetical protein
MVIEQRDNRLMLTRLARELVGDLQNLLSLKDVIDMISTDLGSLQDGKEG